MYSSMDLITFLPLLLQYSTLGAAQWSSQNVAYRNTSTTPFKHVIAISIDGMHSSDVAKWLAIRPNGSIAGLVNTGMQYTDAWTSAPSDSFPGTLAQYTGAMPPTTGVWYDVRIPISQTGEIRGSP